MKTQTDHINKICQNDSFEIGSFSLKLKVDYSFLFF